MANQEKEMIILLDFGAQYSQLIARRIRAAHVYCEILPYFTPIEKIKALNPKGIILSGGPASVLATDAPRCCPEILTLGIPVLGICYGMQLMANLLGGKVDRPEEREYGKVNITPSATSILLQGMSPSSQAWMSHTYQVFTAPQGFVSSATTAHCPFAAMENTAQNLYGVQFHPEVTHSTQGSLVFQNFLFKICHCSGTWQMSSYIQEAITAIQEQVGQKSVLLGLSGGVDSAVAAALLQKAIGKQLYCVFVDHGLLRQGESQQVQDVFQPLLGNNLTTVDASPVFMAKLQNISDPEMKRKIIGSEFINTFQQTALQIGKLDFLAQGTIYPDVIESGGGAAAVIKSHHNVGGLPKDLPFCGIIEPLRYLFKDEVRQLGKELGLPPAMVWRQPFPGPGLAIRIIGDITWDKLEILRQADAILREEIINNQLEQETSQYFAVLTGIRSVGVMGDERTYDYTIALRAVNTNDFMTADWVRLPYDVLDTISRRIVNEVPHVNRIVYDITSKPPASIEWE